MRPRSAWMPRRPSSRCGSAHSPTPRSPSARRFPPPPRRSRGRTPRRSRASATPSSPPPRRSAMPRLQAAPATPSCSPTRRPSPPCEPTRSARSPRSQAVALRTHEHRTTTPGTTTPHTGPDRRPRDPAIPTPEPTPDPRADAHRHRTRAATCRPVWPRHPHAVRLIFGANGPAGRHREREPSTGVFDPSRGANHPGVGFTNISVRIKKAALL